MELMKTNELATFGVQYKIGSISFGAYDKLKSDALRLSEDIKKIVVTEDNIKENKKIVAELNKRVKILEDKRKEIKKAMLIPYLDFETRVKEIVGIVKEADSTVRSQIRELEETERQARYDYLKEIFDSKLQHYNFKNLIDFENHFFENYMANKTQSVEKLEAEMSEWLEVRKLDINTIKEMFGSYESREVLKHYLINFKLSEAINAYYNYKKEDREIADKLNSTENTKQYAFIIKNKKDADFAQVLLSSHDIEFELKEI